jgi:hypothetical protein
MIEAGDVPMQLGQGCGFWLRLRVSNEVVISGSSYSSPDHPGLKYRFFPRSAQDEFQGTLKALQRLTWAFSQPKQYCPGIPASMGETKKALHSERRQQHLPQASPIGSPT